ncbi:MAG: hypothetical protein AABZ57_00055, partial [Candidatus Margulisiibacteriota bacterium]
MFMPNELLNGLIEYQRLQKAEKPFDAAYFCQTRDEFQARLDALKDLQGPEFDAQFLSNVVEASQRSVEKLSGWKGQ